MKYIVCLIIFFLSFTQSVSAIEKEVFNSIELPEATESLTLQADNVIIQRFIVKENFSFGSIKIPFQKIQDNDNSEITFSIKKSKNNEWQFTHTYSTNLFYDHLIFGFPVIDAEINDEILFEIRAISTDLQLFTQKSEIGHYKVMENEKKDRIISFKLYNDVNILNAIKDDLKSNFSEDSSFFTILFFSIFLLLILLLISIKEIIKN